ncbi:hypothetical protein [Desulfovulcanus sp.]
MLQGKDWSAVNELIKKTQSVITFPNYNYLFTRLGLIPPHGNNKWGGFSFTPRCFEILLNTFGYIVDRYAFTSKPNSLLSLIWKYRKNITYSIRKPEKNKDSKISLALGMICKADETDSIVKIAKLIGLLVREYVIVIDKENMKSSEINNIRDTLTHKLFEPGRSIPLIKIANRKLNGDFGAQRNYLQQLVAADWILHFDTDELPSKELIENLWWIIRDCEIKNRTVAGFSRRNFVDGELTAAYPDYQFRLLRRHVKWYGKVHEIPLPCIQDYKKTMIYPSYSIEHYLVSDRLQIRRRLYEDIQSGGGSTENQKLLEKPFKLSA